MIIDLPNTTTGHISKALVKLRDEGGATALGRVLTLVVDSEQNLTESAITAANEASGEHPMRVIVISRPQNDVQDGEPGLHAQIRVGGDAGASEVIVLEPVGESNHHDESLITGLLLPDAPVVAWWRDSAPEKVSKSSLGHLSSRRITDSKTATDVRGRLLQLSATYTPGDTDLSWTRITNWRAQLAAALDQPPYFPVNLIEVAHEDNSPAAFLLAAWLGYQLNAPVKRYHAAEASHFGGIHGVRLHRSIGVVKLERISKHAVRLTQPNHPVQEITLTRRDLSDCIAEELRRLDPDLLYGEIITKAMPDFLEEYHGEY